MSGNMHIFKLLFSDPRVDPVARDQKALVMVTEKGSIEIVNILVSGKDEREKREKEKKEK